MPIIFIKSLSLNKVAVCRALFDAVAKTEEGKAEKKLGMQSFSSIPGVWEPLHDYEIEAGLRSSRHTGFLLEIGYLQVKLQFEIDSVDVTYYEKTYGISAKTVLETAGFICSDKPLNASEVTTTPVSQLLSGLTIYDEKQRKPKRIIAKDEIENRLAELLQVPSIILMSLAKDSYEFYFSDGEKSLPELEKYSKILSLLGLKVGITPAGGSSLPPSIGVRNTLDELSEKMELANIIHSASKLSL